MFRLFIFSFLFVTFVTSEQSDKYCDGYKSDFNIRKAVGRWHVVAIIPDTNFSNKFDNVTCYQVDFSEVDEASLKWMITQRFGRPAEEIIDSEPGEVIRIRYHTEEPFDIWSKAVKELKGCYRQLIDLTSNETEIHLAKTLNSPMLLHILDTGYGPFLIQKLWGRLSAVVYRREPGTAIDKLRPVKEFLSLYRGTVEKPKLCNALQVSRPDSVINNKDKILQ
ncbi:unnamed protein product [Leptosia nina]|uniref:Lipocalin/cytosolic fatty-acid binding domain-containing protein n=1 Tax=Leptosia nina TaxID=320188 RepID=A0AAV1JBX9_9NEOP